MYLPLSLKIKSLNFCNLIPKVVFHFEPTPIYQVVYSMLSQPAITCSKLTIETLEQGVKYVQS